MNHEKMDMHEHPAKAVVTLTRTHTRATLPDETSRESRSEPGTVTWTEPERHAVESLSGEPMEDIYRFLPSGEMTGSEGERWRLRKPNQCSLRQKQSKPRLCCFRQC